jgi:hypothetical protein
LVFNTSNQIVLVQGEESEQYHSAKHSINTVLVTELNVNDAGIDTVQDPLVGDSFVSKEERLITYLSGNGNNINLTAESTYFVFNGAYSVMDYIYAQNFMYPGKIISFKNEQTIPVVFTHNPNAPGNNNLYFRFPGEENFTLKPNDQMDFRSRGNGGLDFIGINADPIQISTVIGLQGALDSKLDAAAYNNAFKGVYLTEAALIAANPSGSVGDYAQVNEVGAPDVLNYNWDNDEGFWVANAVAGNISNNTDELPEGVFNLYYTATRFLADLTFARVVAALGYTPSTAPNDAQKNSIITKPEIEAKLIGEISTHTHPAQLVVSQNIETDKLSTTKVPSTKETFDWGVSKFQPKLNNIVIDPGISRTFAADDLGKTIIFTGTNPVALTLPTNAAVALAIGFRVKVTQQGTGIVTSSTAGISSISDSGNVSVQGETREYVKTDINTWSIEGNPIAKGKLKEIVVQNKTQLLGVLRSDSLYLIDGSFDFLAGETIVVPAGGLNIMGYTFDASRLSSYGVTNHKIFTSPVGGSGNLIIHNIAFTTTGTGAGVFDIIDSDGTHALEMVTVNFEGCKQIGKIRNYRQGTGITIGIYGCADGLQLSGTWTGFKLTNTNCFSFGATGTMFKKDTDTIFSNRLYLEINVDLPNGAKLADFQPSIFFLCRNCSK